MRKPPKANLQAVFERGFALHREGAVEAAREHYKKVISGDPRHFDALHLLGTICSQHAQPDVGASLLKRAVAVNPNVAVAHCALGSALCELGRQDEALVSFGKAIGLQPGLVQAHHNLGLALVALGRREEALRSFDAAIALRPDYVNAHVARGSALRALDRPKDAMAAFDRAISLQPGAPEAHYNRGSLLHMLGRHREALESFDAALALRPDYADAHVNRSLTLLLTGRLADGWREYEWRKRDWDPKLRADPGGPPLTGDAPGRRLFLFHEQGLGDTLQFWRYVKLLDPSRVAISASVQAPLQSLLQRNTQGVEFVDAGRRDDHHVALLSLPLMFGTTLETIPVRPAYLAADHTLKARFAAALGAPSKPRVGLAWSGSPTHLNDRHRSIAFDQLLPLLSEDVQWVALQDHVRPSDADAFGSSGRVSFHGDQLPDFDHTAALVDLTGLVITVDTSIAHLAGALGKPVWVLLPANPDWRWLLDREDSPWYPSARLFRQDRLGDWSSVIEAVRARLRSLIDRWPARS